MSLCVCDNYVSSSYIQFSFYNRIKLYDNHPANKMYLNAENLRCERKHFILKKDL